MHRSEGPGNDDIGPVGCDIDVLWIAEGDSRIRYPILLGVGILVVSQVEQFCPALGGKSSMMDV